MKLFIPSGGKEDWGEELKFALRSLCDNFEEVDVTVYATVRPNLINCEVIEVEKFYPPKLERKYGCKKYEQWFDSINKLKTFAGNITEDRFIYTYDDILCLRGSGPCDIIHYPQKKITPKSYIRYSRTRHGETILSALTKCDKPVLYDYETHTPRIYETEKLLNLFKKFPLDKQIIPYSIASLYFNYYDNDITTELVNVDDYKVGFYGKPGQGNGVYTGDIDLAVDGKLWLNYNYRGLMNRNGSLKEWITNKFNRKSKYERT